MEQRARGSTVTRMEALRRTEVWGPRMVTKATAPTKGPTFKQSPSEPSSASGGISEESDQQLGGSVTPQGPFHLQGPVTHLNQDVHTCIQGKALPVLLLGPQPVSL